MEHTSEAKQVITWLSAILRSRRKRQVLLESRGDRAQLLIDYLDAFGSHPEFLRLAEPWLRKHTVIALRKLCEDSMLYPTCYALQGVEDVSHKGGGGFCDIFQGSYEGQALCLKVVRLYKKSKINELLKAHAREAILWNQLDHPNIAPFYGIFYQSDPARICLVSPWMEYGDIVDYLNKEPGAPRLPFVYDIALGLEYLHNENIIHGDLKGLNVLVDEHRKARIADFGLSTILTDETLGFTKTTMAPSGHTTRWASPELLEEDARPTRGSDIWAFGCVCYEVLTGGSPYAGCSDIQVVRKLERGELPARLTHARLDLDDAINKKLRKMIEQCWSVEVARRPGCLELLQELGKDNAMWQLREASFKGFISGSQHRFRLLTNSGFSIVGQASTFLEELYHGPSQYLEVGPSEDEKRRMSVQSNGQDVVSRRYSTLSGSGLGIIVPPSGLKRDFYVLPVDNEFKGRHEPYSDQLEAEGEDIVVGVSDIRDLQNFHTYGYRPQSNDEDYPFSGIPEIRPYDGLSTPIAHASSKFYDECTPFVPETPWHRGGLSGGEPSPYPIHGTAKQPGHPKPIYTYPPPIYAQPIYAPLTPIYAPLYAPTSPSY